MQGWHSQSLLGSGEVGDPIIKDKSSIALQLPFFFKESVMVSTNSRASMGGCSSSQSVTGASKLLTNVNTSGNLPTIPQALFSSPSMLPCLGCSSYSSARSYLPKGPGTVLFCSRQVPPHAHQTRCPNRPPEFYVY